MLETTSALPFNLRLVRRDGHVVLRERVPVVSPKIGPVAPEQIKPFRLPSDNVSESWNQVMPQLVMAGIEFQYEGSGVLKFERAPNPVHWGYGEGRRPAQATRFEDMYSETEAPGPRICPV